MVDSGQFQPNDAYNKTATIASGASTSEAIDLGGCDLCGLFIPSNFDGTTLTITASTAIDGTYVTVQDGEGTDFTITTAASKYAPIADLTFVVGLRYIKLVSGTSQSVSDTVINLAIRPI
jgi:hypothetical protein